MTCIKNTTRGCCFSTDPNSGEATAQNCPGCHKLEVFDWMAALPDPLARNQIFELQFKNTRKGYYQNDTDLALKVGDIVAVEASPGHDIGIVTLCGELVTRQMKRTGFNPQGLEFKKIYRKAKPYDIEKWQEAIGLEHSTMIRSRQISTDLGLNMKIGDVEYQGDRLKAIFYYIADERVDFRELIKVLADQFRIRVEMRQIGARQEAGRIGGIAACGRELCCSTWMNNFSSVTIGAARHQEISLNPQKLAGQCGKLKCCLNYELDTYIDARRAFPRLNGPLEAMDGNYHLVKSDIFRKIMWFSPDQQSSAIMIPVGVDRVRKIMAMNRRGEKIDRLEDITLVQNTAPEEPQILNVVGEESITRFDPSRRDGESNSNNNRGGRNRGGRRPANSGSDNGRRSDNRDGNRDNRSNSGNNTARPEQAQGSNNSEQRPTARPEQNNNRPIRQQQNREQREGSNRENGSERRGNFNRNRRRPSGNNNSGNTSGNNGRNNNNNSGGGDQQQ